MTRLSHLLGLMLACGCAATVSDREALERLGGRRGSACPGAFSIEFASQAVLPLTPFMSLPAVQASIGGRRLTLFLDTGSPHNLLAPDIVEELDLPVFGRARVTLLGREEATVRTCVHELRAGGLVCRHAPFLVSPGHIERRLLGFTLQRADGLLGMAFLAPLRVTIDLRRGEARLTDEGRVPRGPGVCVVPLRFLADGRPCVAVFLGAGPARWFLLDTCARRCVLPEETARALGLPELGDAGLLSLGVETRVGMTRIPKLFLGSAAFSGVDAYVLPAFRERLGPQIDGVLGIELFSDLALTLDFAAELLVIEGLESRRGPPGRRRRPSGPRPARRIAKGTGRAARSRMCPSRASRCSPLRCPRG